MQTQFADLDRIAFADPAGGKRGPTVKRTRARSAIVVIGGDALQRVFVLHAWADRCSTDTLIERIFETQSTYTPRVFGCEANAMQALFADAVAREARFKGERLPLVPVTQPTNVDKDWRIRSRLQPIVAEGRLFLQDHHVELRKEIVGFPLAATKDLVDALASAVVMLPPRPPRRILDEERAELAKYLRDSGVEPWRIEHRLAEYDQGRR